MFLSTEFNQDAVSMYFVNYCAIVRGFEESTVFKTYWVIVFLNILVLFFIFLSSLSLIICNRNLEISKTLWSSWSAKMPSVWDWEDLMAEDSNILLISFELDFVVALFCVSLVTSQNTHSTRSLKMMRQFDSCQRNWSSGRRVIEGRINRGAWGWGRRGSQTRMRNIKDLGGKKNEWERECKNIYK